MKTGSWDAVGGQGWIWKELGEEGVGDGYDQNTLCMYEIFNTLTKIAY